ncbi:TSCPD domain-containing protein [Couchioplanes caeruleus]|uniref:ribonucleoside-diphosphate reductase n=1 Tax=Couchioplanes caeruleus subsp. caeruleus TaxID=56427 RepID=A0A1K0FF41_9ACTN|nr:hypothetical protein [Couchioplanes caeruleus]OJF11455.1 hypothetical protein BG844_26155 [Couchioplanes caeruleus subsp. caeruleus]
MSIAVEKVADIRRSMTVPAARAGGDPRADPIRRCPARSRRGVTYDLDLAGIEGSLTITELPDGRPGEVFLRVSKQGSTLSGLCEALSMMTSLALQHDVPLREVVRGLLNQRFEPAGHTADPDIPTSTSLVDYIARRLAVDYLSPQEQAELGLHP